MRLVRLAERLGVSEVCGSCHVVTCPGYTAVAAVLDGLGP
jgi:hypothetical protein